MKQDVVANQRNFFIHRHHIVNFFILNWIFFFISFMKQLNSDCINLLSSGQVITSVIDAIKELIENSLDSGAKTIKIKIEDIGLKSISVTDDGSGIPIEGRDYVAMPYTTSKIISYEDLSNDLNTYGFRGEALHSICSLSDLTIITRTLNESIATYLNFNKDGTIKSKKQIASPYGTTIIISNLLNNLPVRVREERTNFNIENFKNLLIKYYFSVPNIRFIIDFQPHLNYIRPPLNSLNQAISNELGPQISKQLVERSFETYFKDIKIKLYGLFPNIKSDWKQLSTSKFINKQYLIINGRPVKNSMINKFINEYYWKIFGNIPKRLPIYILTIDFFKDTQLNSSLIDINTDVTKSSVIFGDEQFIIKLISNLLNKEDNPILYHKIKEWPNLNLDFNFNENNNIDILKFGTFNWILIGKIFDYHLFEVKSGNESHIISMDLNNLFEEFGITSNEINRTTYSELILIYWEQILELNNSKKKIIHLLKLI